MHDTLSPSWGTDRTAASIRGQCGAGFTLVELMITVAIVAILASVAYPSYIEYVARGHRSQLKAQMSAAQQWMERYYSERYFYGDSADAKVTANTAFASQGFAQSPPSGEGAARYTLAVVVANSGQTYTITATRAGTMSNDGCGNLSITNTGVKTVANQDTTRYKNGSDAVAACWN